MSVETYIIYVKTYINTIICLVTYMEVLDFKYFDISNTIEADYCNYPDGWSAIYKYPAIVSYVERYNTVNNSMVKPLVNIIGGCDLFKSKLEGLASCYTTLAGRNFDIVVSACVPDSIDSLLEQVKIGGYIIVGFDISEDNTNVIQQLEKQVLTKIGCVPPDKIILNGYTSAIKNFSCPDVNCCLLVIKKCEPISVILDIREIEHLAKLVKLVEGQTVKPVELCVLNRSDKPANVTTPLNTIIYNTNNRNCSWDKFFIGFDRCVKYIAVIDGNNCILDNNWLEQCLHHMKNRKAVYGSTGYKFSHDGFTNHERLPDNSITEVDFVCDTWFLKRKWLRHFVEELPSVKPVGDGCQGCHLSYTVRKYGRIPTYTVGQTCGTGLDSSTLMECYKYWVCKLGYNPISYKQFLKPEYVGPFRYKWHLIYRMLKSTNNFGFIRFGDGELALMVGRTVGQHTQADLVDKWTWISKNDGGISQLGKDLLEICGKNKRVDYSNMYYAYATSDNLDQCIAIHNLLKPVVHSTRNIFYANQFINTNYRLTEEYLHNDLIKNGLGHRSVIVVCNEQCRTKIERECSWINLAIYYPDDIVNWWEGNHTEHKQKMGELARRYTNALFAFCVGPLSKVLIDTMFKVNPNNKYIDFGSTFDLLLKGVETRGYQIKGNYYYEHDDKILRVDRTRINEITIV